MVGSATQRCRTPSHPTHLAHPAPPGAQCSRCTSSSSALIAITRPQPSTPTPDLCTTKTRPSRYSGPQLKLTGHVPVDAEGQEGTIDDPEVLMARPWLRFCAVAPPLALLFVPLCGSGC